MIEMLLFGLRHLLTLLFGVAVSAAFLDIAPTRKKYRDPQRFFSAEFFGAVHFISDAKQHRHVFRSIRS